MIKITAAVFMLASSVQGAEYDCPVEIKFAEHVGLHPAENLAKYQYSVKIRDTGETSMLSRCSYAESEKRVTCDDYEVDHIETDPWGGHKKFYYYRGQFDVQLFANLKFVENNGRGSIAFGTCKLTRP